MLFYLGLLLALAAGIYVGLGMPGVPGGRPGGLARQGQARGAVPDARLDQALPQAMRRSHDQPALAGRGGARHDRHRLVFAGVTLPGLFLPAWCASMPAC